MGVICDKYPELFAIGSREELLHEGERTRVTRVSRSDGGGTVVLKEFLGPDSQRRLQHEQALLERLAGIVGIARLSDVVHPAGALLIEDCGGMSLASAARLEPLTVADVVQFAPDLAQVIAAIHQRGVVHKDITPANIVLAGAPPTPWVIDFDLATTFAQERPRFTHQSEVSGTLAYLAPEQTGRTGRPVDHRADLYGLGATLYELVTGRPPFDDGDPLQMIHDHLARLPVAPIERNGTVPQALSDVLMRLLAKEPDQRYQSAEGLLHDLIRLRDSYNRGENVAFVLAERDFPLRLLPPSRLIGRDQEIATVAAALAGALTGRRRGLLVSGAPGVGKTMLLDELRPMVTAAGGWFVTGKFDQFRQDEEADAGRQALRALTRMLLAEPQADILRLRERILSAIGNNTGLAVTVLPELGLLLQISPDSSTGDPMTVQARMHQAGLGLLRSVASAQRPVALIIDDLQWAAKTPMSFIDAVLTEPDLPGVLLVGAYRDAEVDSAHPLTALLSRWERLGVAPQQLRLVNLPMPALGTLLADMLRISPEQAVPLADAIGARTDGNPYDTVELVNALRRDGALVPGVDGWQWDAGTLRRHLGAGDVVDLLAARMEVLPAPTRVSLEIMACLGGDVETSLLRATCEPSGQSLDRQLRPALEDGLLVMDQAGGSVRFRHDRVQQAALARLDPSHLSELRLTLARRLAARPEFEMLAAEQFLPVVDALSDRDERRRVCELFRAAAVHARRLAGHVLVERYSAAALRLIEAEPPDIELLTELGSERHAALYNLGRLDEADETYTWINSLTSDPFLRAASTWVQVSSLTNRDRPLEALAEGLSLLRDLGVMVPGPEALGAAIGSGLDALRTWATEGDENTDVGRPEYDDPRMSTIATTINRMLPPAVFADQATMAWLVIEAARMWAAHGPAASLIGPMAHAGYVFIAVREDYRTGAIIVPRVRAISEARGYEPNTSHARFLNSLSNAPWFDSLENAVLEAHRACEGLIEGGDLHYAVHTYYSSLPPLLDSAATLGEYLAEVDSALALSARTGSEHGTSAYVSFRQFVRAMRGETAGRGEFNDPGFEEAEHQDRYRGGPPAAMFQYTRTLAAALFGDDDGLTRHSAAMMAVLPYAVATYPSAMGRVLRALSLAIQARTAGPADRASLLAELDVHRNWLAARAAEAPGNFRHLLALVDAERAWAVDDFRAAAIAFDLARRDVTARRRPWQQALITERSALFHLAYGIEEVGHMLLREARGVYAAWGASGKVADLDRCYPALSVAPGNARPATPARRSETLSGAEIDFEAVMKASHALSSETDLARLRERVTEILGTLTGATSVRVVLWNEEAHGWFLPSPDGDGSSISVDEAAGRGLLPLSAFRYAERTREPLVVDDSARDDRFDRDSYFAGVETCSLLVVPILSRGMPQAMLVLENRLSRAAFSADRLDGVMLIAGQLAVSLDNAALYASLERKVVERTEALGEANARLQALSVTDPLTGLANRRRLTDVLGAEWQRGLRSLTPIALAMIDVDHFKLYNDRYGHPAGDQCLRSIAAVLTEVVRTGDLVARYGGEEFVAVLPGADTLAAQQVAERARDAVAALGQPHELSPHGTVTVSIGVIAVIPAASGTPEQLLAAADGKLYDAKRSGRNQVAVG